MCSICIGWSGFAQLRSNVWKNGHCVIIIKNCLYRFPEHTQLSEMNNDNWINTSSSLIHLHLRHRFIQIESKWESFGFFPRNAFELRIFYFNGFFLYFTCLNWLNLEGRILAAGAFSPMRTLFFFSLVWKTLNDENDENQQLRRARLRQRRLWDHHMVL